MHLEGVYYEPIDGWTALPRLVGDLLQAPVAGAVRLPSLVLDRRRLPALPNRVCAEIRDDVGSATASHPRGCGLIGWLRSLAPDTPRHPRHAVYCCVLDRAPRIDGVDGWFVV